MYATESCTLYSSPPSMLIHIARRYFIAVRNSKTFHALLRYPLTVVQFPGLISFLLLCVLYSIADYTFTKWYFLPGGDVWTESFIWTAAFPSSWRKLFLSLYVVPTFAFIHLLWFSLYHLVPAWQRRKYTLLAPFQNPAPQHLFEFVWSPRFVIWFAIFCTSLWVGLHYQQPADLRYLPLIERANAHPKRVGYANQGKYLQSRNHSH